MKKYKHLFFDLDHTLWDYDVNTELAVSELYEIFNFSQWTHFTFDDFMVNFHKVNNYLWDRFNHGHIGRMELRNERFAMILKNLAVPDQDIPKGIGERYLELAPVKPHAMPHAHEILDYLKPKYQLHIISNGFDDVQHSKLKASKIHHYFNKIVTSDSSNFRKPQKEIFEYAMKEAGASLENALMIGDNLDTDIIGAQNASMDHIFYNPKKIAHTQKVTYEIESLKEIMNIL